MRIIKVFALLGLWLNAAAAMAARPDSAVLRQQVADTERAFAATMKARNLAAFVAFVADDAVFFNGPTPLHGKQAVGAFWKKFFDQPAAPFSWEPDQVEVLASGKLAASSGPVYGPDGKVISRFNSIWRLQADGKWQIVYDKGEPVCDCKKPAGQ